MQVNIIRATANGQELNQDDDLDHVQAFEVRTNTRNSYIVQCRGPAVGTTTDWDVCNAITGSPVGRIRRRGAGAGWSYRYYKTGALFSGGKQSNLWNAVQSLIR